MCLHFFNLVSCSPNYPCSCSEPLNISSQFPVSWLTLSLVGDTLSQMDQSSHCCPVGQGSWPAGHERSSCQAACHSGFEAVKRNTIELSWIQMYLMKDGKYTNKEFEFSLHCLALLWFLRCYVKHSKTHSTKTSELIVSFHRPVSLQRWGGTGSSFPLKSVGDENNMLDKNL